MQSLTSWVIDNMLRKVAMSAGLIAGLIHLGTALGYYLHTPAQGIWLAIIGLLQVAWVLSYGRYPTRLLLVGQSLLGAPLLLWLLTFFIRAPFGAHVQPVDIVVVLTKSAELIGWLALLGSESHRRRPQTRGLALGIAIAITVNVGFFSWVGGTVVEPIFPRLGHAYGLHPLDPPLVSLWNYVTAAVQRPPASTDDETVYRWELPPGFPLPRVPADNPMTAAKVELGRYLFYDPQLSGNGTMSCSSCHLQALAFTDGKVTSHGSTGDPLLRNSQALVNVAYNATYTWANPVLTDVEQQVLIPLFAEFPVEMGIAGNEAEVLTRFQNDAAYLARFAAAFPEQAEPITYQTIVQALASFVRSLISGDSPYDRYLAGDDTAISAEAKAGMGLFFSERFECHHCHVGFNLTTSTVHEKSTFSAAVFQNNGLYNLDGQGAYPRGNRGLYEITNKAADMGRFRPPTLRNVALTAPYMHDGSLATLDDVVRHYAAGGRLITTGELAGDGRRNPLKSTLVPGFTIEEQEVAALVAFLESLTDETFITDPRFSNPFLTAVNENPVAAR
ncbi:MAG: di-heme enzyme [Caldilineaceae bacterium]|nr:di-heme enzyme [Caldilineaceae bacterium]